MPTLVIAHTSQPRAARRALRFCQSPQWVFLDGRYVELLRWKRALAADAEAVMVGPRLNAMAHELRIAFLEAIAAAGRRFDLLSWSISRVAERNPLVRPLFLRCCQLATVSRFLRESARDTLVVSDSAAVLKSIGREAARSGWEVRQAGRIPRESMVVLPFLRVGAFLWRAMRRRRGPAPRVGESKSVLMRTWIDESAFDADGAFRDRYFGSLAGWLEHHGAAVTIIPVLFNVRSSAARAWARLARAPARFLNPYALYRASDYVRALRDVLRESQIRWGRVTVGGLDVSELFEEERRATILDGTSLDAALWFALPQRLAARGDRVDTFIDLYENLVSEKPLTLGFRKFMSETRLISFQHGMPSPLLVSIFVTRAEATFAPLPDRIITIGDPFRQILIEAGLPAEKVVTGPALRYQYLTRATAPHGGSGSAVLVALPLPQDDAVELLIKVHEAFSGESDLRVLIKPHPMSSTAALLAAAGIREFPNHFELVSSGIEEALAQARVLITIGSSTALEAAAAGVVVFTAGRDAALDLNPLQWVPELDRTIYEPSTLRAEVRRYLMKPHGEVRNETEVSSARLRSMFRAVDEASLSAFSN